MVCIGFSFESVKFLKRYKICFWFVGFLELSWDYLMFKKKGEIGERKKNKFTENKYINKIYKVFDKI